MFPNNVVLLKSRARRKRTQSKYKILVINDIMEFTDSKVITLKGKIFGKLEDAFCKPYVSSRFQTYLASSMSNRDDEFNINLVCGKMFCLPFDLKSYGLFFGNYGRVASWFGSATS